MKAHVYLTLNKSGVVKMTKEKPNLSQSQRAVRLTVAVPDAAFAAPPVLDAELTVPANMLIAPEPAEPIAVDLWEQP